AAMHGHEGVTVMGSASVDVEPDIVVADMGVDVRDDDVSTALRAAEAALEEMRAALRCGGSACTAARGRPPWRRRRASAGPRATCGRAHPRDALRFFWLPGRTCTGSTRCGAPPSSGRRPTARVRW